MHPGIWTQLITLFGATLLLAIAILLLAAFRKLFPGVQNILLRRNLAVALVALFFMLAFVALQSPEMMRKMSIGGFVMLSLQKSAEGIFIALFVFNVAWWVSRTGTVRALSFTLHHTVMVLTITVAAVFIFLVVSYFETGWNPQNLHYVLIFAFFASTIAGLIYTGINYADLESKRKLSEKELELTRLNSLKTKAELDALHSKVNPHFLYNALNSIADLAITDGRKARNMTIALADLFRYSINYSNNNFSTLRDEVEMADVYLQIEKIRFEDQLNYNLSIEQGLDHYLVPRFVLQPLVENAVKHGLKATGKMTEIDVSIRRAGEGLVISIADNGPAFGDPINPGYGVKSVFDKMDLLFPCHYAINFINSPVKQVTILIQKLVKDESAFQNDHHR